MEIKVINYNNYPVLKHRSITKRFFIFIVFDLLFLQSLWATEYHWGSSFGLGGTGIQKTVLVDDVKRNVVRSEGPGLVSLYVEDMYSETMTFGLEYSRGFRLGPFSSGVSFSGVSSRWYFIGSAPSMGVMKDDKDWVFIKQISFFIGGALGIAMGDIERDNDKVSSISASGVYLGGKVGFDYPLKPGKVLRLESVFDTSFYAQEVNTGSLNMAGLLMGIYYIF